MRRRAASDEEQDRLSRSPRGLGLQAIDQTSAVISASKALRDEILRRQGGDLFLGSEDDLVKSLGVSQPTFRQAARLLEYEELLSVRRGVGGGYFIRRPSAEAVARMAGTYLLSHGTSYRDVIRTQTVLEIATIELIIDEGSDDDRSTLLQYVIKSLDPTAPRDLASGIAAINGFWQLAGEISGNRSIALFMLTSQAYGASSNRLRLDVPRVTEYLEHLKRMCAAIVKKDAKKAISIRRASSKAMEDWVRED